MFSRSCPARLARVRARARARARARVRARARARARARVRARARARVRARLGAEQLRKQPCVVVAHDQPRRAQPTRARDEQVAPRGDIGEMWARYGRDVGEMWARYGRGMGEIVRT